MILCGLVVLLGYTLSVSNIISVMLVKSTLEKYHSKVQYYRPNKVVQTIIRNTFVLYKKDKNL